MSRLLRAVHVLRCPALRADELGVLARVSQLTSAHEAQLATVDVHVNADSTAAPEFLARTEFLFDERRWSRPAMDAEFSKLAADAGATHASLRVQTDAKPRVAVLVSHLDHCLTELLHRWDGGELDVDISCVVSNHARERSSHLRQFCERKNVNFFYVPAGGPARPGQLRSHEPAVLSLISRNSDFVVLARFMQILSSRFLRELGKDVINIHHGLLPSFKGAHPYRQAYNAGVKVIGATAHFVTEELDCGPIIEQQVARVSHRDTVAQFAEKSRSLEKSCLFQAVKLYSEARVVRSGNGRVVVLQ
jgi:formyltetrahydrofolate deformylase